VSSKERDYGWKAARPMGFCLFFAGHHDSSVSEEHNKFRNTPMLFELIMKGITKLQLHGFKNITFESIIMGSNYKRIPSLIELTKEIGVRKIMFRPINIISNFPQLSSVTNKNEFADYDVEEIIKYIDLGIAKAKELNVDTDLIFNRKWITEYFRNLKVKDGFKIARTAEPEKSLGFATFKTLKIAKKMGERWYGKFLGLDKVSYH